MSRIKKIMHLTDLHFNPLGRIPQSRTSKFHKQINNKWFEVNRIIKEEGISLGLISGDIFHLKNPKLYNPEDVYYYSELLDNSGINWISIPGNHDEPESSFDQIEKSPYNLLVKATRNLESLAFLKGDSLNSNIRFYLNHKTIIEDGFVPINIHGFPYFPLGETISRLELLNENMGQTEGFNILMLHMDVLVDPSIFLFWPVAGYDTILDKVSNADLICLGHIHQSLPVYKRINPKTNRVQIVSKPWSFSRVAKDYFNKTDIYEKLHKPSYSLLTFEQSERGFNVSVEYREIPCAPFEEAFKRDTLKKQIENNIVIKDFIQEIKNKFGNVNEAFKIVDPEEYLKSLTLSEEVRNMINKYVERARK